MATQEVKQKLLTIAAIALQVDQSDLYFEKNHIVARSGAGPGISYAELAALATPSSARVIGVKPGISAEAVFHADRMAFPYGVHQLSLRSIKRRGLSRFPNISSCSTLAAPSIQCSSRARSWVALRRALVVPYWRNFHTTRPAS